MVWTRLDDNFADSPKLARAIGMVGDSAGWAWVRGCTYCNKHLTDGFIPAEVVAGFTRHKRPQDVVAALVKVGAWDEVDGGYTVHDFLDWNDSKEKVVAEKQAAKARKDAWRRRRENADSAGSERFENGNGARTERVPDAVPDASVTHRERDPRAHVSTPTQPNPTQAFSLSPAGAADSHGSVEPPKRTRRPKPDEPTPTGHAEVVAAYFEAFEALRGSRPTFDGADGKAVSRLLGVVGGDRDRAIAIVRGAYTPGRFGSDTATIRTIASDPSRYLGAAPSRGIPAVQRAPGYQAEEERKRAAHAAEAAKQRAAYEAECEARGEEPIPF